MTHRSILLPRRGRAVLAVLAFLVAFLSACSGGSPAPGGQGPTAAVTIASLTPAAGPTAGGTEVAIDGSGFAAGVRVTFGDVDAAQLRVDGPTRVVAVSPAHAGGAVDVTVTRADGQGALLGGGFRYDDPPSLASLDPGHLPQAGGTVILHGAHFAAGARVLFGADAALGDAQRLNELQLVATAAGHAPGVVDVTVVNPDGQRSTLPAALQFDAPAPPPPPATGPPALGAIVPASGPESGGTVVTLSGSGFDAAATATFGGAAATVTTATATALTVVAPPHAPGAVDVAVANPDGQRSTLAAAFAYVALPAAPPAVTALTPASGPAAGGTTVSIAGSGFQAGATVSFGALAATVLSATPTALTVLTPAQAAGAVDVAVANPDGQRAVRAAAFTYLPAVAPPPTVASVTPASGPTAGGTALALAGAGFQPGAVVTVGGAAATVSAATATSLQVTTPAHAAGAVSVAVRNPDGQSAVLANAFTYVAPPPLASALTPASGPDLGGTAVTLSGSGFAPGAAVTFGGAAAASLSVTSTALTVTTPAHVAGAVDVVVANPDGQRTTLAGGYVYLPPPLLAAAAPASGPAAGGTSVVLSGSGFQPGARVALGGVAAPVVSLTPSALTVTAPAHAAGAVDVVVTNPDGRAATLAAGYAYLAAPAPAPAISGVTPASGPSAGGSAVVVSGAGFDAGAAVAIGGAPATITARSATALGVTTPAHAAGAADVTVTNGDGQVATLAAAFAYVAPPAPPPSLASVAPASGPTAGGTAVLVSGANFQPGATVTLGGAAAPPSAAGATALSIVAPAHAAGVVSLTVTNPDGQSATLAGAYTYVAPPPPPPLLASLSPAQGPDAGGTAVTLSGTAFQAGAAVSFGGVPATVGAVSATSIAATAPAHVAGVVDVVVTNPDGQAATLAAGYAYVAPPPPPPSTPAPVLASLAPAGGPTAGGTAVALSGASFQAGAQVTFGGAVAAVASVSATAIAVTAPPHAAGAVDVTVTNPDGQRTTLPAAFAYAAPPALVALSPPSGLTSGGTAVTLTGSTFDAGASVTFAGLGATVTTRTAASLAVVAPAHPAGAVDVTVTNADGQSATLAAAYVYVAPPPAIAGLSPASGSTLGGTPLTITGSGFQAGAGATLGGAPAAVAALTATSLTVTTPAHAAGAASLTITNPDGQVATLAAAYTYVAPPPALASLTPASGPDAGGTSVTLAGAGFQPGATVSFGGAAAVVGTASAAAITATTPPHLAGTVDVTVTNPDGQSSTLAAAYVFVAPPPPPALATVAPARGPVAGGTAVALSGSAFQAGARVSFGGAAAAVASVSATAIAVAAPPHAAGVVDVTVTNPDGRSTTLPAAFAYVAPPALASVAPASGLTGGGTAVTLTGSGFDAGAGASFGGVPATVTSRSATSLAVVAPAHAAGAVDVTVTNSDGQAATLAAAFAYALPPPGIVSLAPASGTTLGGASVAVTGAGFQVGASATLGGSPAIVAAITASSLTLTTPPHAAGAVALTITNPDGQAATLAAAYTYVAPPPALAALAPAQGPAGGGTSVTLSGSGFQAGASVSFGGVAAAIGTSSASAISVTTPAHAAGAVDVVVTNPDGQGATLAGGFTFVAPPPPPALASVTPASGSTAGGASVVLAGNGFASGATVTIGGLPATVAGVTATAISATTPAHAAGAADVVVTNPDGQASTLAGAFAYVAPPPPPALASLTPASGSAAGGDAVTLAGSGFATGATVAFGGAAATVTVASATSLTVATPPGTAGTSVDVAVTNPDGQSSTLAAAFAYVAPPPLGAPPAIVALTPTSGFDVGGTTVVISGSEFVNPSVAFGGVSVAPSLSSKTSLTVVTPPHAAGVVDVTVTNSDGQTATLVAGYTYVVTPALPPPVIAAITPSSGPTSGNTVVTIAGTGFVAGSSVAIGGTAAILGAVTATTITVTTPGGPAGPQDVTVTNPDRQVATAVGGFTYVAPPPVVTAINVRGSPQAGGGLLLFAGTGLQNTVSVTFGGVPATGLTYDPLRGALTVVVPASPLGPTADGFVDLALTNLDGQSTTWPNFHYGNPPNPTAFSPSTGPKGTVMVVDGTDFTADTTGLRVGLQVSFGGVFATITAKSSTQITLTVPKLNPGVYQVLVTNFDSQFAIAPGTYTVPGP